MKRIIYLALALMMLMGIFAVPAGAQEPVVVKFAGDMSQLTSLDNQYWTAQLRMNEGTTLEGLFGYDKDGITIIPKIAESWETNDDYTEWTIHLREDKKWSNGEPVTAAHFYDAWVDFLLDSQAPLWASFLGFCNGYNARGANDPSLAGIELVDEYTLKIMPSGPRAAAYAWLPMAQAMPNYTPIVEEFGSDWWQLENWVGNGPYVPVEFTAGEFLAVERNPEYVGEEGVDFGNADRIEFLHLPPGTSSLPSFESGEVDVVSIGTPADIAYVENNEVLAPLYLDFPSFDWQGYSTNKTHGTFLDNRNLRHALYMSLDREYLTLDVMQGLMTPAHSYGWAAEPRIVDNVEGLPYDPDMAREKLAMALEELGVGDVSELPQFVFYTPPATSGNMPMYEEMVRMWQEELGLDVIVQPEDWGIISTYTWGNSNPTLEEGFVPMGGAMNQFEPSYIPNQSMQTVWHNGWTGEIRQMKSERDEFHNEVATIDTPPTQEEVDAEFAKYEEFLDWTYNTFRPWVEAEGFEYWYAAMNRGTQPDEQFQNVKELWEEAETDEEKVLAWQNLLRATSNQEVEMAQNNWRMETEEGYDYAVLQDMQNHLDVVDFGDEAFQVGADMHQLLQEVGVILPIGITRLRYLAQEGVTNVVPRYISWGWLFQFQYITKE